MSHLSTTMRIDAPATAVFDVIADPARSPEWQTMLVEMGGISGRPGGIGSSFVGFYRVAGRRLAGRFVVTAAERPNLFQVNGTTAGGWARWTTMIEADGSACVIRVRLEYELPGEIVGSLFGLLAGSRVEREFRRTYDNLKALTERASTIVSAPNPAPAGPERTAIHALEDTFVSTDDDGADRGGRLATT